MTISDIIILKYLNEAGNVYIKYNVSYIKPYHYDEEQMLLFFILTDEEFTVEKILSNIGVKKENYYNENNRKIKAVLTEDKETASHIVIKDVLFYDGYVDVIVDKLEA